VIRLLKDGDPVVRMQAVGCVVRIAPGEQNTLRAIAPLLKDSELSVQRAAIQSFRVMKSAGEEAVEAFAPLLSDPRLQLDVISVLLDFGSYGAPAVPQLVRLLDPDTRSEVRAAAIHALGGIGDAARGAVPVVAAIEGDARLRSAVASAIGAIGHRSPEAISALERLAQDKDDDVRDLAELALRRLEASNG
jgi:HEAT repeat protein